MSAAAGWVGWGVAAAAGVVLLVVVRGVALAREQIARGCHELRGPLTTVRLGLSLAGRRGGLSEAQVAAIDTELCRATLALDDLGRVRIARSRGRGRARAASTPSRPRLEPVALGRLVAEAVTAAEGRAAAAGGHVRGGWEGAPETVWADRLRLVQALDNLIANAIEHGGGRVTVRGLRRDSRIQIFVDDDGQGLPATVAELAARPRGGRGRRGRGLAIARAAAELHGGTVVAAPSARGGRVVLELPAGGQAARVEA